MLPDKNNKDFTFLQYADDLYGHVVNYEEDNSRNFCFLDQKGCFVVLNLLLQNTKSTVTVETEVITTISQLHENFPEVRVFDLHQLI